MANGLEPDVPLTWIDLPEGEVAFPVLRLTDTVKYLCNWDLLSKFMADMPREQMSPTLQTFWRRFGKICPGHEVFSANVSLSRRIPALVHGDEGRGFKKTGVMMLSLQGCIGGGVQSFLNSHSQSERDARMGLNLYGSSFNSRFLFAAMAKKHYSVYPETRTFGIHGWGQFFLFCLLSPCRVPLTAEENYQALCAALVDDLLVLQKGFKYRNETWHIITLGMKGDLPYLAKTGRFMRHWLRAERQPKETKKGPRVPPVGVCWLCHGGTDEGGPWEDFRWDSSWAQRAAPEPWHEAPHFLKLYHEPSAPERVFRADIWHNYHGGVGKLFVASVITEAMWFGLVSGSSRAAKIGQVNLLLRTWAKRPGNHMPHSGGFTQERIGLTSWAVQPDGSWSKHDDTHVYHNFLEDWLTENEEFCLGNPTLRLCLWAVRSINACFRILYQGGLWLPQDEARLAGTLGRHWLRCYAQLASLAFQSQKLRFPLVVKLHMVDHAMRDVLLQCGVADWVWNPLGDSVQHDEDFIGHAARLSRRVGAVSQAQRVLERYRTKAMKAWGKTSGARAGAWVSQRYVELLHELEKPYAKPYLRNNP